MERIWAEPYQVADYAGLPWPKNRPKFEPLETRKHHVTLALRHDHELSLSVEVFDKAAERGAEHCAPIVFLAGFGDGCEIFKDFFQFLKESSEESARELCKRRWVTLDLPRVGETWGPDYEDYSWRDFAHVVSATCAKLGVVRPIFTMHSAGCLTGLVLQHLDVGAGYVYLDPAYVDIFSFIRDARGALFGYSKFHSLNNLAYSMHHREGLIDPIKCAKDVRVEYPLRPAAVVLASPRYCQLGTPKEDADFFQYRQDFCQRLCAPGLLTESHHRVFSTGVQLLDGSWLPPGNPRMVVEAIRGVASAADRGMSNGTYPAYMPDPARITELGGSFFNHKRLTQILRPGPRGLYFPPGLTTLRDAPSSSIVKAIALATMDGPNVEENPALLQILYPEKTEIPQGLHDQMYPSWGRLPPTPKPEPVVLPGKYEDGPPGMKFAQSRWPYRAIDRPFPRPGR